MKLRLLKLHGALHKAATLQLCYLAPLNDNTQRCSRTNVQGVHSKYFVRILRVGLTSVLGKRVGCLQAVHTVTVVLALLGCARTSRPGTHAQNLNTSAQCVVRGSIDSLSSPRVAPQVVGLTRPSKTVTDRHASPCCTVTMTDNIALAETCENLWSRL